MDSNNKPIRIIHVLGALNRGGAETMIMNIYRCIDKSKIQFDFIIHTEEKCDYTDEVISLGGKIYSMEKFRGYNYLSYVKQFHEFFSSYPEYRVVHGHMRSTASLYLSIAKKYKLYTIAHSHNTSSGKGISSIVKNIMQRPLRYIADYYFACSLEAGRWLFGERIINSKKFSIIRNAINIDEFKFNQSKRKRIRKKLNIESNFVIGNISRFHLQKNHKFIINVFKELLKKNKNAILILVGDGELKNDIECLVRNYGIEEKVMFLGVCDNVAELMQAMDVFFLPSLYEGLPVTMIEAQASGLNCVISSTITDECIITDNVTKISLNENLEVWTEIILELEEKNRNNYIGKEIYEYYDIHVNAIKLEKFYLEKWGKNE